MPAAASPPTEPGDRQDHPPPWLQVATKKRRIQAETIAPFARLRAPPAADAITAVDDVAELAARVAGAEWTAFDVVLAYIQWAARAHEKTNCLTEILFDTALERARELDDHLATHGRTVGPLHGVPMTLKDQFNVQGYDSTLGYVGRAFRPAAEDADVVKTLREAGVVFIAKTNLPQSIMWCETENQLFGRTTHHLHPDFTPGGSTGGEGSLLALHGSLVGWGTDIGGSVRIPAHMSGLYGLKPSASRLPYEGVPVSTEGQEHVPSAVGPLARSLASVHLVTKYIIEREPWRDDPRCDPISWREDVYQAVQRQPLVIGLMLDDGVVKVHPPVERIIRDAAAKLEAAGHKIVPWGSEGHAECIEDHYYTADGGEDIKRDIAAGGEPFVPHVQALVSRGPAISVYEYWQLHRRKRAAQRAYLRKWRGVRCPQTGREVDVLLMPVMPHSAVPHRHCRWVGYTKVWNFLDYTALVLPGGRVDRVVDPSRDDAAVSDYRPRNELDRWNWGLYDPDGMHGMPVGMQLVGRRLEEERVLGAAKVVEGVLRS